MSSIVRAISPQVSEPPAGTWSNCLVVGGIAYLLVILIEQRVLHYLPKRAQMGF